VEKRILFILTGFSCGAGIGLFVYYNHTGFFPEYADALLISTGTGIYGILQLWTFYQVSQWLNKRIPLEKHFSVRITIDFIINGCLGILSSGLALFFILKSVAGYATLDLWLNFKESFLILWVLVVVMVLMYNIIMLVFYAYYHYAEGQIVEVKIERKQLKLQFEALKSQLSPHYLFNSLNTISSLIHQDPNKAEDFIRRLADTYQYILNTHQQQLISLEKELEFVKAYYYLLCVRYTEGLNLEINIPEQLLNYQVPPLTVQILVENAIKHNVFSKETPLNIYLGVIDNVLLKVINNKTKVPKMVKSNHIGLKNIEKRYGFFTKSKVKIIDKLDFEVNVPIIKDKTVTTAA
jgi:two-component system, LytTR family, sensor kinase